MNTEINKEKWMNKVIITLTIGGRSERTIVNYISAINRFLHYYDENTNIKKLKEEDILNYIKLQFIDKGLAAETYNLSIKSLKYFYSICFDKELNKKKLPNVKLKKRLPTIITKETFIKIFNNETKINHKCWLLLAFCCGLRVEEVATIKIENILSKEHKLKVLGKNNKERYTILPDIVIKYLRIYYKKYNLTVKSGFLFKGTSDKEHVNSHTIINYFSHLKKKYDLDKNITFHCLRHSFATYFLMNGGNILTLKSLMGHKSLQSTSIYIHISQNFNKIEGIKYV